MNQSHNAWTIQKEQMNLSKKSKKLNLKYNGGTTLFGLMIIILGCLPDRPIEQRFLIVVGLTFFLFFIIEFRRCRKINRAIECAYNDKNNYPYGRITSPSKVMPPENSTSKWGWIWGRIKNNPKTLPKTGRKLGRRSVRVIDVALGIIRASIRPARSYSVV